MRPPTSVSPWEDDDYDNSPLATLPLVSMYDDPMAPPGLNNHDCGGAWNSKNRAEAWNGKLQSKYDDMAQWLLNNNNTSEDGRTWQEWCSETPQTEDQWAKIEVMAQYIHTAVEATRAVDHNVPGDIRKVAMWANAEDLKPVDMAWLAPGCEVPKMFAELKSIVGLSEEQHKYLAVAIRRSKGAAQGCCQMKSKQLTKAAVVLGIKTKDMNPEIAGPTNGCRAPTPRQIPEAWLRVTQLRNQVSLEPASADPVQTDATDTIDAKERVHTDKALAKWHAFFVKFGHGSARWKLFAHGKATPSDIDLQYATYRNGSRFARAVEQNLRLAEKFVAHQLAVKKEAWSLTSWEGARCIRQAHGASKSALAAAAKTVQIVSNVFGIERYSDDKLVKAQVVRDDRHLDNLPVEAIAPTNDIMRGLETLMLTASTSVLRVFAGMAAACAYLTKRWVDMQRSRGMTIQPPAFLGESRLKQGGWTAWTGYCRGLVHDWAIHLLAIACQCKVAWYRLCRSRLQHGMHKVRQQDCRLTRW